MADAHPQRCGGTAMKVVLRLCAFALLLPMALSLSAAEQSAATRIEDPALKRAYAQSIRSRVVENWLRPDSVLPGQRCSARISQLPTGTVVKVEMQSDCQFDAAGRTSLENAVRRAQPLPTKGFESVYVRDLLMTFIAE